MNIAIFYHCLFFMGDPPALRMGAFDIVSEQMNQLEQSGLLDACSEMHVGINGGDESLEVARLVIPQKARLVMHCLKSKAENLTIVEIEKWAKSHPGWAVFYFHAKGCTHEPDSSYALNVSAPWRRAMMQDLVIGWRECVAALESGADICCSHWMWNMADGTQHIPAGNFLWVTSNFVLRLPSIYLRDRIKQSGIDSEESRYEAEVYWGNGPRPVVVQQRPMGGGGVP